MASDERSVALTAAEIASLWAVYQENTLNMCAVRFFLQHVEDPEVRDLLEYALSAAANRNEEVKQFFHEENHPIPHGFTDEDVHFDAPRLFSDKIYHEYVLNITALNIVAYGSGLTMAARKDVLDFYSKHLQDAQYQHKQTKELAKQKGYYVRTPRIPVPEQIDFVKKDSFLSGWLGERRPLLGVEIAHLSFNSQRNALGQAVITGFSQVAQSKEIREYFEKGRDISGKHHEVLSSILRKSHLEDGALFTPEVTASTIPPFSDRLMMHFVTVLIASGLGQYGMAMAASPRHDIAAQYAKLMAEIGKYANEGANILIHHGWMEQPPIAADRENLAKGKQ